MSLKVNSAEWNALSAADQQKIAAIMAEQFDGATIEPEDAAARLTANPTCEAACNVAEAAAIAACANLGPIAAPFCIAAARELGNVCRSRC